MPREATKNGGLATTSVVRSAARSNQVVSSLTSVGPVGWSSGMAG